MCRCSARHTINSTWNYYISMGCQTYRPFFCIVRKYSFGNYDVTTNYQIYRRNFKTYSGHYKRSLTGSRSALLQNRFTYYITNGVEWYFKREHIKYIQGSRRNGSFTFHCLRKPVYQYRYSKAYEQFTTAYF